MNTLQRLLTSGLLAVALLPFLLASPVQAQFNGNESIISTSENALDVHSADIDNDGDLDALSAAFGGNNDGEVYWYENDGSGTFVDKNEINGTVDGVQAIHVADLDGDGDQDVFSASVGDDEIQWYENRIDQGSGFSSEVVISSGALGAQDVYSADLDGDGDQDVLSANEDGNTISWWENDGSGNFGNRSNIATSATGAISVYAADITGNGAPLDVVSASRGNDEVVWYENDGNGNFGNKNVISNTANNVESVFADDLDGDGDGADVVYATFSGASITWHENDGGSFGPRNDITTNANKARSVYTGDIDGDGDQDVLSAAEKNDEIAWYENQGGTFGSVQIIDTDATDAKSVFTSDLNGDGCLDVLWGSTGSNGTVAWNQNSLSNCSGGGGVSISLAPSSASNPVGTSHTVTATVVDGSSNPIQGKNVDFEVTSGPNAGDTFSGTTDTNGDVTYTTTSSTTGTDLIVAETNDSNGNAIVSNQAGNTWTSVSCDAPTLGTDTVNPPTVSNTIQDNEGVAEFAFTTLDSFVVQSVSPSSGWTITDGDGDGTDDTWTWTGSGSPPTSVDFTLAKDGPAPQTYFLEVTDNCSTPNTVTFDPAYDLGPAITEARLAGNTPNPFSGQTTVEFALPEQTRVTVAVYDVMGRKVATLVDDIKGSGTHTLMWNGQSDNGQALASGVYLMRMKASGESDTQRVTIVR